MNGNELWLLAWGERDRLLRIARRRSLSAEDAEDVVSEAIMRSVNHPTLDPERLPAMLTAVVMRLCVDRLRDRIAAELAAPKLAGGADVDELAAVLDHAEAVWLAAEMTALAGRERAALAARTLGLSMPEIAEALGVSYKAAESALDRAKRKLRAVWARTLGALLILRLQRRQRFPALLAAVTAALTTGLWLPPAPDVAVPDRRPDRQLAAPTAVSAGVTRQQGSGRAAVARPTAVLLPTRTSQPTPTPTPLLRTPPVDAGPVRKDPVILWLAPEQAVTRIEQCARNGVDITISVDYTGVTCRDGP